MPVIVIDGDGVVLLEVGEVIEDERRQVTSYSRFKLPAVMRFHLAVAEYEVLDRQGAGKTSELGKQPFAIACRYRLIPPMPMKEVLVVERHVLQSCNPQALFVCPYRCGDVKAVVVQNDRNQIQVFGEVLIARFVDMRVQPLHQTTPEHKYGEVRTSPLWNLRGLAPFGYAIIPRSHVSTQGEFSHDKITVCRNPCGL